MFSNWFLTSRISQSVKPSQTDDDIEGSKDKAGDAEAHAAKIEVGETNNAVKMEDVEMNKEKVSDETQESEVDQNIITQDEVDTLISSLDEIYRILESANEIIAQPALKAFPTTMKIIESSPCDNYATVFSFLKKR